MVKEVDALGGAMAAATDEAGIPPHISLPDAAPGLVELWPLIQPAERREIEPGVIARA